MEPKSFRNCLNRRLYSVTLFHFAQRGGQYAVASFNVAVDDMSDSFFTGVSQDFDEYHGCMRAIHMNYESKPTSLHSKLQPSIRDW